MKIKIWLSAEQFQFSTVATSIYEACEVIDAARLRFNLDKLHPMDMDEIMEYLVRMKNGHILGHHNFVWGMEVIQEDE